MHKRLLVCVSLLTLAWGQAAPAKPEAQNPAPPAPAGAKSAAPKAPAQKAEVPMDAVVLTIKGVCPAAPKTAAASKAAAGKAAPATKPADCKTEITRAQFEKMANGISWNSTPQFKKQLEQALPRFMAMSEAAKKKGMENTDYYKENLKIAKMQILTNDLQHSIQVEADNVPEAKIAEYYKNNPEAYQQFSIDRLFIPKHKQIAPEVKKDDDDEKKEEAKDKEEKLTPEQQEAKEKQEEEKQKAKEAEEKAKQEQGDAEMAKLAESLQVRAAAGEDMATLQKEAFDAAGTKVDNPKVNLPKVRRTGLPPAHSSVFELKVGEVSKVIDDNGGHYIYKIVSKETLPLDDTIKGEIHNKLKADRLKEMMDKYTNSYSSVPNEAYFGAGEAGGPMGGPQRPHMPMPTGPQSQPSTPQAPAQPPAAAAPPSKPN